MWQLIKDILLAISRFFVRREQPPPPSQETQEAQDTIVAEAAHEIEEVPNKTDAELDDVAADLGILSSGGAGGTGKPTD